MITSPSFTVFRVRLDFVAVAVITAFVVAIPLAGLYSTPGVSSTCQSNFELIEKLAWLPAVPSRVRVLFVIPLSIDSESFGTGSKGVQLATNSVSSSVYSDNLFIFYLYSLGLRLLNCHVRSRLKV